MACGLLSAFSSPLCQVPGSPARFTQYFSVLGRVSLLPTFLSVVIIFLIFTSSFWVLYLIPLLFQVYFRCSLFLDLSPLSSILPSCGDQGSASLRVNWWSPASNKPHKPRAAHASGPAWCGSEDLAPSEATGFFWTLFLLPFAWDRGHLFSVIMISSSASTTFSPPGAPGWCFPTFLLVITFAFHFF